MGFRRAAIVVSWIILASAPVRAANPNYSVDTIINPATQTPGYFAPNGLGTIYGTDLSFNTSSVPAYNLNAATLPLSMGGVSVVVGGLIAGLIYVSPTQINFVVPYLLTQGTATLFVARNSLSGPVIKIQIYTAAPAFFTWKGNYAIAVHLDGSLIAVEKPAQPGELVVLFVSGLGRVWPDIDSGRIASAADSLYPTSNLQVFLGGTVLPPQNILYAGLAPGYAGLYQINARLPNPLPPSAEIRVVAYGQSSPGPVVLALPVPAQPIPVAALPVELK